MSGSPRNPTIFISYSHKDEPDQFLEPGEIRWLTYVRSFLEPAAANGIVQLWDDRRIDGGGFWRAEINDALERCAVCVFLVSRHSLSSRFILDVEIKRMLERHHTRGAHLYPILITSTDLGVAPWLQALNLRPSNATALELYAPGPRNKMMSELAAEIRTIIERTAADVTGLRNSDTEPTNMASTASTVTVERALFDGHAKTQSRENLARTVKNLRFDILRNSIYYSDESAFFSNMHRTITFLTILAGAAIIGLMSSGLDSKLAAILAGIVASLASADLVFDLSGRATLHASLRQRYLALLGELERKPPTEQFVSYFQEAMYRLQGEEPPVKWCVEALAWNSASASMMPAPNEADLIAVNWWERLFRHVVPFSPDRFRRRLARRSD